MEKSTLLQFEFQGKNNTAYWFPLLIHSNANQTPEHIHDEVVQWLGRYFTGIRSSAAIYGAEEIQGLLKEYIADRRSGHLKLLKSIAGKERIVEDKDARRVHFTKRLQLHSMDDHPSSRFLTDLGGGLDFPMHAFREATAIDSFESYPVVELAERVPAYLWLSKISVMDRGIGFLVGLIISMTVVLTAFEWKTALIGQAEPPKPDDIIYLEDEMIPITVQKDKEEPKPKKDPVKDQFKIVEKVQVPEPKPDPDPIEVSVEKGDSIILADIVFEPDIAGKEDDIIHLSVQHMPTFRGCEVYEDKAERKSCTDMNILKVLRKHE